MKKYVGKNSLIKFLEKVKQYIDGKSPDMSDYVKKTQYGTFANAGIVKLGSGLKTEGAGGLIGIIQATDENIKDSAGEYVLTTRNINSLAEKIKTLLNVATKTDLDNIKVNSETVLYENTEGTSTDFTLSQNAKDFDRIKVFYKTSDEYLGSIEFMTNKTGNQISSVYITQHTYGFRSGSYSTNTYFVRMQFYSLKSVYVYSYYSQDGTTLNTSNKLFITKVIGIKEAE